MCSFGPSTFLETFSCRLFSIWDPVRSIIIIIIIIIIITYYYISLGDIILVVVSHDEDEIVRKFRDFAAFIGIF